jgi:succinyl-CoA synthetase beta subunit
MQLLEHEGKQLLAAAGGLPIPRGALVSDAAQANVAAAALGSPVVVKAQVPAGGRGKAGGIHMVHQADVAECTTRLLSRQVCGFPVPALLVEEMVKADQEVFLAVALSPAARSAVLLMSREGGVDVERFPEKVALVPVPALIGLRDFHVRQAAHDAGLDLADLPGLIEAARAVYRVFMEVEADLVEINPLFRLPDGGFVAGDVRVVPAEGGAYQREHRQPPQSVADRARLLGFDLVELDAGGQVGLLSTGAGASMLVVDLLKEAGLRPMNFCDLRSGRARGAEERLRFVFDYMRSASSLRCLAINFFAGVTDLVTFGTVLAETIRADPLPVPVVVRLAGMGADQARRRLLQVGATVVAELDDLIEEAGRVVRTEESLR